MKRFFAGSGIALIVILTLSISQHHLYGQYDDDDRPMRSKDRDHCQEMMQWHQEQMQQVEQYNEKLDELVQTLNTTEGEEKIDAMEKLLTELASQHQTRQQRMMERHQYMMDHMTQHIMKGMSENSQRRVRQSMDNCPYMQQMEKQRHMHHDMRHHSRTPKHESR